MKAVWLAVLSLAYTSLAFAMPPVSVAIVDGKFAAHSEDSAIRIAGTVQTASAGESFRIEATIHTSAGSLDLSQEYVRDEVSGEASTEEKLWRLSRGTTFKTTPKSAVALFILSEAPAGQAPGQVLVLVAGETPLQTSFDAINNNIHGNLVSPKDAQAAYRIATDSDGVQVFRLSPLP